MIVAFLERGLLCRSKRIPLSNLGRLRLMPSLEQVTCREPTVTSSISAISSRLFPRSTRFLTCSSLSGVNFICLPRVGSCVASSSVCIIFVSLREQLLRLTPPVGQRGRRPEVFRLVARGVIFAS